MVVRRSQFSKSLFAVASLGFFAGGQAAIAVEPLEIKIQKVVDGADLTVEGQKAAPGSVLREGQTLRTGSSRAEILFNRKAIGLVGPNTELSIGDHCFNLISGTILVNGPQSPCIGSRRLAVSGTTYVVSKQDDQTYSVTVLSGKVGVTDAAAQPATEEIDILDTYPKVTSSFGTKGSGFGDTFPGGASSAIFGATYFTPLAQSRSTSVLYSYTTAGYSTNDIFGFGTEIGYRKFHPSNQSISSVYLGYSGFSGQACFGNFANAGAQWERSRWRIGATGGLKANDCPAAFSFAAINLSAPIASYKTQPVYLSLSPYYLFGNVTDPLRTVSSGGDSNSSSYVGGRLSVEFPISQALSLRVLGSVDTVFGVQAGGTITYRIPTSGSFISDRYVTVKSAPNRPLQAVPTGSDLPGPSSFNRRRSLPLSAESVASRSLIAMQSSILPAGVVPLGTVSQLQLTPESPVAKEGERLVLSADGSVVSTGSIPNREYADVLKSTLKGQNPIPESHRLAVIAQSKNVLSPQLSAILGLDMMRVSSLAVSETLDTPFTPTTMMPMGRYVCEATTEAKRYGLEIAAGGRRPSTPARPSGDIGVINIESPTSNQPSNQPTRQSSGQSNGRFVYSNDLSRGIYFGRGRETPQGYPATYNRNDAYVFVSPDACNRINQYANESYKGTPYDIVKPVKL